MAEPTQQELLEQYKQQKGYTPVPAEAPTQQPETPVAEPTAPDPVAASEQVEAGNQELIDKFKTEKNESSLSEILANTSGFMGMTEQEEKDLPRNLAEGAAAIPISMLDFGGDAVKFAASKFGLSTEALDDAWDEKTKFKNPAIQSVREMASVILPTIWAVRKGNLAVAGRNLPLITKGAASLGITAAIDGAIIGISDEGEKDTAVTALVKQFPWLEKHVPSGMITLDGDSPQVRREKNRYESVALSIVGDILGYTLSIGKPIMRWFKPKNDAAKAYKASKALVNADNESMIAIAKIDEALATEGLTKAEILALSKEKERLGQTLLNTGVTNKTSNDLESYIKRSENTRKLQTNTAAIEKLRAGKTGYDPDIFDKVSPDAAKVRQSLPNATVAKNMGDTTAIKKGVVEGDPSPFGSESMLKKGLASGGATRNQVMGVAKHTQMMGDWDAVIDGFKFSKTEMDNAAWDIYQSIMQADSVVEVKKLFLADKDFFKITDKITRQRAIAGITPELETEARGMAFALRDLTDRYLGRTVTESSARVMDTLGRETTTIAEASRAFRETADENRVNEIILDKMQFLFEEYGLNKYISGWQLQKKNWWTNLTRRKDAAGIIEATAEEFQAAVNANHKKAMKWRGTIEEVSKTNPQILRSLVDAYALSKGDVDTLMKLNKFAEKELTWTGMIKSPDVNKLNTFTKSVWAVRYNNVLSGISALRAVVGNGTNLILKPVYSFLGHGIEAVSKQSIEPLKRAIYYHQSVMETNRRALADSINTLKQVNNDPKALIGRIREDYVLREDKTWDIFEGMVPEWERTNNRGMLYQYHIARNAWEMSQTKWMRYGMTGMTGVDSYTNTMIATHLSRVRAYDDVFTKHGKVTPELLEIAEKKHYRNMFDANGFLTDKAAKNASGEIALNLDDGIASWMNKATTAAPVAKGFFMFPRTGMNTVKMASSYTPLMAIPGMNKYTKILHATSQEQKIAALLEHGIDYHKTPNAEAIFQNLKNEYRGRLAFAGLMSATMFNYAMSGNIRGNGPASASERKKMRDNYGWKPKTIKIGPVWVSYQGIPGVETVLTLIGDAAYYMNDLGEAPLENVQDKLMWTFAATMASETPLAGFETMISALSQDESAFKRYASNEMLSYFPMSGGLNVVAKAIDSAQKDIHNDMMDYILNRTPILSKTLAMSIDIWTGQPLNDIDNPLLRALNAISPIKVSGTAEPWRIKLLESGWDGVSLLKTDSTGKYSYSAEQREAVTTEIGKMQLYKEVEKILDKPAYQEDLRIMREFRKSNVTYEQIKIKEQNLPVFRELNKLVRVAKKIAEKSLQTENPEIYQTIIDQQKVDQLIRQGRPSEAIERANDNVRKVEELLTISK